MSLYTNIPIKDCIIAIDLFSHAHCRELIPLITELSRYILTNNYFVADGRIYHQINGLAMGTPMAVVAANIYMAQLESRVYEYRNVSFFRRFIDDIFLVWNGNHQDLDTFLHFFNNLTETIKIKWIVSTTQVTFLDICIFKDGNSLAVKPYQKPLNRYLYIPFNSYHPSHTKASFITAELTRYVRLSSKKCDFLLIRRKFFNRLLNRGYPTWLLLPLFDRVSYDHRNIYLTRKRKSNT